MDLEILKIASDTSNFTDIKKYTHYSRSKNSICGDEIHVKLIIDKNKIKRFVYHGNSCVYCLATASLLSNNLIDTHINKVSELCDFVKNNFNEKSIKLEKNWNFLKKILKKENFIRKQCILLPFNALEKIVTR